jgi:hypothetical protein
MSWVLPAIAASAFGLFFKYKHDSYAKPKIRVRIVCRMKIDNEEPSDQQEILTRLALMVTMGVKRIILKVILPSKSEYDDMVKLMKQRYHNDNPDTLLLRIEMQWNEDKCEYNNCSECVDIICP